MPSRSPSPTDLDLLSRLNALKKSRIGLDASSPLPVPRPEATDDLAARFLRFNADRKPSIAAEEKGRHYKPGEKVQHGNDREATDSEDDKTVEELLADIGPDDQWTLKPEDPRDIARLMNQAKETLATREGSTEGKRSPSQSDKASQREQHGDIVPVIQPDKRGSHELNDHEHDDPDNEQTADAEAEAYLQQVLDELVLEKGDSGAVSDATTPKRGTLEGAMPPSTENKAATYPTTPPMDFPSTPSTLPLPRSDSLPAEDVANGSDPLQLPSAPTTMPGRKPKKADSKLPTYTDAEIQTWCIICNNDATVRCIGCDGDLYCAKCWREGHVGPDVSFEERKHRWTKYEKPGWCG